MRVALEIGYDDRGRCIREIVRERSRIVESCCDCTLSTSVAIEYGCNHLPSVAGGMRKVARHDESILLCRAHASYLTAVPGVQG